MATVVYSNEQGIVIKYPRHFHTVLVREPALHSNDLLYTAIAASRSVVKEWITPYGARCQSVTHKLLIITDELLDNWITFFNSIEGTSKMVKVNRDAILKLLNEHKNRAGSM